MKKVIASFLSVILLSYSLLSVFSVAGVTRKEAIFSIGTYSYSPSEKKMVSDSEFKTGETVYIAVSVSDIAGIGGFALKMGYDSSIVKKAATDIMWFINDDKSDRMIKDNGDNVIITWETYSSVSNLSGLLMYVPFVVLEDYMGAGPAVFTLKVEEAFENNAAQTTINTTVTGSASIAIVSEDLPADFITLVTGLKTITYNPNKLPEYAKDSLEDINKALADYKNLTSAQKEAFYRNYPELYEALSNAKNKYYELAASEADKLAKQERDAFLAKYGALLDKDINELTLENDGEALSNLATDYPLLSSDAKKQLTDYEKERIVTFINKKAQLEKAEKEYQEALQEVADFKAEYDKYVGDEEYDDLLATWSAAYTTFEGNIVGAILWYDNILSDIAKEMLKTEKERLDNLYNLALQYADDVTKEQAILDEVAEFIKTYSSAFMINAASVSIADKSLIELAISAYDELQNEDVKERLSIQIENMKKFLTIIEELEEEDAQVDTEIDVITPEPEKEIVTNTVVNTQTVTKLVDRINNIRIKWRTASIIMAVLLACSVCCYIVSVKISQKYAVKQLKERMDDDV